MCYLLNKNKKTFANRNIFVAMLLVAFLFFILFIPVKTFAQQQSIHALRSAYLYYFSHFISWPENTRFSNGELNLCVLTNDDKDRYQLSTINNKSLGEYSLHIEFLSPEIDGTESCHMLYVTEQYESWLSEHVASLKTYTLLVTEGEKLNVGEIHLYTLQKKLKFEIDNKELTIKNFKASSKLLRLSKKREG